MANKHLLIIFSLVFILNLIKIREANHFNYDKISVKYNNYKLNDCLCHKIECFHLVNEKKCLALNAKFKPKSLVGSECDCCPHCCPHCLIQNDFFQSCYNSILGYRIECTKGWFCSKKDGFICRPNLLINKKQYLKHKKVKYIKFKFDAKQQNLKVFANQILKKVPQSEKPLKRIPRSPFKLGIRLGRPKTNGTFINETGEQSTSNGITSAEQLSVQVNKKINAISGGNANSINSNIGPTFIINNNYRYSSNGKLVPQKIRMSKDGNFIYETDQNAAQTTSEAPTISTSTTTSSSTTSATIATTQTLIPKKTIELDPISDRLDASLEPTQQNPTIIKTF